jgi:hypothetical protein
MTPEASRSGRRLLLAAFLAALAFTGFHVFRTVRDAIYWNQHRDEPIEGWMSVGFVAHSYHVPPHVLLMAIGLPPGPPPDKRPLATIASAQGRSLDRLEADLQYAIVHARPPYPPPPPPPPPKAAR